MRTKRFVAIFAVAALVALLSLLIAPYVFGATTISTSISTSGNLTVTGDATISGNTTLTGFTQHSAGTVSLPSISFVNDANTGIYSPSASGEFAITIDGTQRFAIGSSTQNVTITGSTSVSGVAIYAAGSVSTPSIAFSGDPDTGIFRSASNTMQLVAGGNSPLTIGSSSSDLVSVTINGTTVSNGRILASGGAPGNTAFSFSDDSDTGILGGSNSLQLVAGGNSPLTIGSSSSDLIGVTIDGSTTFDGSILAGGGTLGNTAYSFSGDPDTGILRSASNTMQLVAGGYNPFTIGSSSSNLVGVTINGSTTIYGRILANSGEIGSPGFSFSDDPDTGIYGGGNILKLIAGGNGPLTIGSSTSDLVGVTISGSTSITGNLKSGTVSTNGSTTLDIAGALTTIALCHGNADLDDEPIVDCSGAPSDIAEYYETTSDVETGDIVTTTQNFITYKSIRLEGAGTVVPGKNEIISVLAKSSTPYQSNIIGIVSTAPYQLFGEDVKEASKHPMPIALAGRVPVKVTNENGVIRAGDWLAASSKPGYAMKATGAGYVVGIALANFDGQNGKILALVKPGYIGASQFQGGEGLSIQSTSGATSLETVEKLVVQKNATIQGRLIVKGNARFDGQITVGKDTAGMASLKAGQKTAHVDFAIAYKKVPMVTVTPLGNPGGYYWVSDVSEKGFTVNVSKAPSSDLGFNWIALGSNADIEEEEEEEEEAKAKVETAFLRTLKKVLN